MKKIYFFAIVAFVFSMAPANAQFVDDIETYNLGALFTPRWTTWDGTNTNNQNAIVSDAQAFDGSQSIFIGPASLGPQDAVLDFGGVATSGVWTVFWRMYVPSGSTGYFNLQGNVSPSANDNLQFLSGNITLVAGTLADDGGSAALTYPEDTWFTMRAEVDVDAETYELVVEGASGGVVGYTGADFFGGVDFFSDSETNTYFVDDVRLVQGVLGVDDFSADVFSVYPNPVKDVLNISSKAAVDTVVVFDVLGKKVLEVRPGSVSPKINMSNLSSGAYLVQVTIDGASKTIKVIK
ncbi:T9SS type A sorting domain-containing protein [Altibacter sp.]|uniref:T9SS type A sorting domain-containing protein n=1 Tax=Altibacter sp. TaxID=2024823 RepID=UPI00258AAA6F|nr:T9SS type A sorting domain-containing protein [Altibacter sp.]MCW8979917.1 T9SS type A sorting domain-containing protein [Altibacter sp.]MCW9038165.1 T9SS type A sorting domain-containing protein [Altibacter sp.]